VESKKKVKNPRIENRAIMRSNKKAAISTAADRISELPEEIIHLILGSLTSHNEAARTSILSRRWLSVWRTYPVVECKDYRRKNFSSFTAATSKRLLEVPLLLDSFTISLGGLYSEAEQWLRDGELLLSSCSTRSPLKVVVKNYLGYIQPSVFLDPRGLFLNCGRTRFLDLTGFDLSRLRIFETCLDNLQELCLENVQVGEQNFPNCLANAPCLEKLSLKEISGIHTVDISGSNFPSLKSLYVYGRLRLSSAPLLETLRYQGLSTHLDVVASAPSVKFVKFDLDNLGPTEDERGRIDELIPKFPHLESLHLRAMCYNRKLRISAHTLRELTVEDLSSKSTTSLELEIDAPNLVLLTVVAQTWPKIKWNAVNVAPSCRCVFGRFDSLGRITTNWLTGLRKCLAAPAAHFHHRVLKLRFSKQVLQVKELNLKRCFPLKVQHLLMGIDFPIVSNLNKADDTQFFDAVLSAFHPKKLSIAQSRHDTSLFSYVTEQIERANLEKCSGGCKCWRHRFKDVEITSMTVDDMSTIDKSIISQPPVDIIFIVDKRHSNVY
ncbi:Putative F-box/LRR-repeat protein At3g28410, partial [Linum grandiflorum]